MSVAAPPPASFSPWRRLARDIAFERGTSLPMPPGPASFSMRRTTRFARDPLPILLDAYREHGPVFSVRILHAVNVFMLGPEANHYVTVSHAANFNWRDGGMGDLMPLLGDGLLTIDGDYHRRARRIMLPAFHRERLAAPPSTRCCRRPSARSPAGGPACSWTSTAGRASWRCGSPCGRCSASIPTGPPATPRWRPSSSARWASTASDYLLQTLRGPLHPLAAHAPGPARGWTG